MRRDVLGAADAGREGAVRRDVPPEPGDSGAGDSGSGAVTNGDYWLDADRESGETRVVLTAEHIRAAGLVPVVRTFTT